jgi:hypothetical protein
MGIKLRVLSKDKTNALDVEIWFQITHFVQRMANQKPDDRQNTHILQHAEHYNTNLLKSIENMFVARRKQINV